MIEGAIDKNRRSFLVLSRGIGKCCHVDSQLLLAVNRSQQQAGVCVPGQPLDHAVVISGDRRELIGDELIDIISSIAALHQQERTSPHSSLDR